MADEGPARFFAAVRRLNRTLPPRSRVRVALGDPAFDFHKAAPPARHRSRGHAARSRLRGHRRARGTRRASRPAAVGIQAPRPAAPRATPRQRPDAPRARRSGPRVGHRALLGRGSPGTGAVRASLHRRPASDPTAPTDRRAGAPSPPTGSSPTSCRVSPASRRPPTRIPASSCARSATRSSRSGPARGYGPPDSHTDAVPRARLPSRARPAQPNPDGAHLHPRRRRDCPTRPTARWSAPSNTDERWRRR